MVTGCHEFYCPMNIGFMSSSQLTNSFFSEGWRKTTNQLLLGLNSNVNSILDISYGRFIYIYIYICVFKKWRVFTQEKKIDITDFSCRFMLNVLQPHMNHWGCLGAGIVSSLRSSCWWRDFLKIVLEKRRTFHRKKWHLEPTHDGSVCMIYIYIYANKTGVFVDGKCGSTKMAYIRIRHGQGYDSSGSLFHDFRRGSSQNDHGNQDGSTRERGFHGFFSGLVKYTFDGNMVKFQVSDCIH